MEIKAAVGRLQGLEEIRAEFPGLGQERVNRAWPQVRVAATGPRFAACVREPPRDTVGTRDEREEAGLDSFLNFIHPRGKPGGIFLKCSRSSRMCAGEFDCRKITISHVALSPLTDLRVSR